MPTEADISADVAALRTSAALAAKAAGDDPIAKAALVGALAEILAEAIAQMQSPEAGAADLEKIVTRTCEHIAHRALRAHFALRMGTAA